MVLSEMGNILAVRPKIKADNRCHSAVLRI